MLKEVTFDRGLSINGRSGRDDSDFGQLLESSGTEDSFFSGEESYTRLDLVGVQPIL